MHPFTSLTLWGYLALTSLLLPLGYPLVAYSFGMLVLLILMPDTRYRWRYVALLMVPMGCGLWLVHSGWLAFWLTDSPVDARRMPMAIALWLRLLAMIASAQIWLQKVPTQQFIRALFASRLPTGFAYLLAGPLLIVEQLGQQLSAIREAQLARGVALDGAWYQRLSALPALLLPLTSNALNEISVRGAALEMRAFRLSAHRTTLWAPSDSRLQQILRYALLLVMLLETGVYFWW